MKIHDKLNTTFLNLIVIVWEGEHMEAGNFKVSFGVKYSVSFFICGFLMSIFFFLRRSSLIGDGDDFNQYYPVYIYIGKYIRDILCGGGEYEILISE